jgi:histidinol dehydrogenase
MKIIRYPKKEDWKEILQRPVFETADLTKTVSAILNEVKSYYQTI